MKKLFAVILAWTLFSTQAFAQTAVENEKVAQLQKMIDSHLADLEDADIQEVQAFFAGKHNQLASISQEELEEAITKLENMNLEEARELATSLGIEEELSQITEEEWQQYKSELVSMIGQAGSSEDSYRLVQQCFVDFNNNATKCVAMAGLLVISIVALYPTALWFFKLYKWGGWLYVTILFAVAFLVELGIIVTVIYQALQKRIRRPDECRSLKDDSCKEPTAWLSENLRPMPLH